MQGNKLYVGNLKYSVTSDQLKDLFSQFGEVVGANVIEGKGFGFVEMDGPDTAERAKEELNGTEFEGRTLRIDKARPPKRNQNRNQRRGESPRRSFSDPYETP